MNGANENVKSIMQKRFEHLFGRPRLYILLDTTYELFNPFCKSNLDIFEKSNIYKNLKLNNKFDALKSWQKIK
jgi:ABC-type transport system involved in multi-copper enzyme maturation permease subunit